MARVWVYPERTYEALGARRWRVEWQEWKDVPADREPDLDRDLTYYAKAFRDQPSARQYAATQWRERPLAFGVVEIQEQVVDWFVEEDRVAEWSDVGNAQIIETEEEARV